MATPKTEPRIYVMGNPDIGMIKIGFSRNPEKRLKTIQQASGIKLNFFYVSPPIVTVRKTLEIEKDLHKSLADFKLTGEWFNIYAYQMVNWEDITPESLEEFRSEELFCLFHPEYRQQVGTQKFFRERYKIPNQILDQLYDGTRKFYKQWRLA